MVMDQMVEYHHLTVLHCRLLVVDAVFGAPLHGHLAEPILGLVFLAAVEETVMEVQVVRVDIVVMVVMVVPLVVPVQHRGVPLQVVMDLADLVVLVEDLTSMAVVMLLAVVVVSGCLEKELQADPRQPVVVFMAIADMVDLVAVMADQ